MSDIIDIASKEVGYKEGAGNKTKYGKWNGANGLAWCHSFVSWCAYKAGYSSYVPKTAACATGAQWFKNKKRFKSQGTYTPKRNDIIYFYSTLYNNTNTTHHVGIVEYTKNGKVYTIEGNSNNMVRRKSYNLSDKNRIMGYGLVHDYISNTNKKQKKTTTKKTTTATDVKTELKYINKMLKKNASSKKSTVSTASYEIKSIKRQNPTVTLCAVHSGTKTYPYLIGDVQVTLERKSAPGKLEFKTSTKAKIYNGDAVLLYVNKKAFFYGYVFSISPNPKDGTVSFVAYDQLRYFKNKSSYYEKAKTATQMLKVIAKDFGLNVGTCEDTKIRLKRLDQDQTLFDIMENYLVNTTWRNGNTYVLYDDVGKLRLRQPWKVNTLISDSAIEDYSYKKSIDEETYNQIKLYYENTKSGTLDTYVVRSSKSINRWGTLQYYEKVDSPKIAKKKAQLLLQTYNKQTKTLEINNAFGSTDVRAGCLVPVMLTIYEDKVSAYLIVDKVVHKFEDNSHTMNLTLSGGGFDSSY